MADRALSLFFLVFFSLYGAINVYLGSWLFRALASSRGLRPAGALFVLVAAAYPAGRLLSRSLPGPAGALLRLGNLYLAFMATAFAVAVAAEAVLFAARLFGIRPSTEALRRAVLFASLLVVAVTAAGAVAARFPQVRVIDLELPRLDGAGREMTVAFASDLHAGTVIHNARLAAMVDLIAGLDADLILLGGDLVDRSVTEAVEEDLSGELARLKAPLGVFSVAGNHEYYAGLEAATAHIEKGGVTVLLDEARAVADTVLVVGRHDVQAPRFGFDRRPLAELTAPLGGRLPVIVVDHTPRDLAEAASAGAALQLSGHTHRGQLWPFNLLTEALFEIAYGPGQKDETWIYVSSGLGTWGPPVRTSGRPEVILFRLRFR
ncbi:metallophosphoesterase [Aminithiophilus ramosus]|uniref:Metallophosphoesterase n=2 Tax=Synergistales TaxID=649776 RepID=A0A9Q7AMU0_9BACT|nr:metallophosphoesterase [Aminithiophilus ramosus]QTX32248.1 metallophosphoesterase [Aminithiophilus ramosus]QVL36116.1 metallophosphoesterase [Synergistota bacterium]